jgi:hypothetical protein
MGPGPTKPTNLTVRVRLRPMHALHTRELAMNGLHVEKYMLLTSNRNFYLDEIRILIGLLVVDAAPGETRWPEVYVSTSSIGSCRRIFGMFQWKKRKTEQQDNGENKKGKVQ